jgi:hypothetical protein
MIENTLIDDQSLEIDFYEEVQQKNKKYLKRLVFLSIINIILFPLITIESPISIEDRLVAAFVSIFITLPMLSFIIGLVFAFIPYKGLTWSQKYKRASLLLLLIIHSIMIIGYTLASLALLYKYFLA